MKNYENRPSFDNSFVDRSAPMVSISTILGLLQEPFDQQGVAEKTFNKRFNDPNSEYYQMSVEQIIEKWQAKGAASLKYGRLLDDYIGINLTKTEDDLELYKLDNDYDGDERLQNVTHSFDSYLASLPEHVVFVAREVDLFYKIGDTYVRGRFDALFYDNLRNKWLLKDWKSSGTVDTKPTIWTGNLLGAAKNYKALNHVTYTMQLFFYKLALIANYLPEGTTPDDVEVEIVNLPGHLFEDGKDYATYSPAFEYDEEEMTKILTFGIKKDKILNKK